MTRYTLRSLVPSLRRYARLMTGDPRIGDDAVLAMLVQSAPPRHGGAMYRLMLFRALTGALAAASLRREPNLASISPVAPKSDGALVAAACGLPFIERAVLGLAVMEELSVGEVSAVLKMPYELVERCLQTALERLCPLPALFVRARA